jgi:diguanylate cyclase (GGDEF)-like protein
MDALPAVDLAEHDPEGLIAEIEQILRAGTYGSRFTKAISDHFKRDSKKARSYFTIRAAIIATLSYNLFLFADAIIIPDVIRLAIVLQLCIGTPVALGGIWWAWRRRLDSTMSTIFVSTIMMLTTVILFSLSRAPHSFLIAGAFPLYLIAVNVGQALPFKAAFLTTVGFIGVFATAIFMNPSLDWTMKIFSVATLIATGHYSLVGNYRIEASFRRTYLYTLKESLRSKILARTNDELATMVNVDGLTGIANRRQFDESLQRIWREARTPVAILLIDIDSFKTLNDTYGHQAGDLYLRAIAQALAGEVGDTGIIARYGGEEFVAILPDSTTDVALSVAERLHRCVETLTIRFDTHDIRTSVSIGYALGAPSSGRGASDVLAAADAALYRAKAAGRNCTRGVSEDLMAA